MCFTFRQTHDSAPSRWLGKLTPQYGQLKFDNHSRFRPPLAFEPPPHLFATPRGSNTWVVASPTMVHRRGVQQETIGETLLRSRGTQTSTYKTSLERAGSARL